MAGPSPPGQVKEVICQSDLHFVAERTRIPFPWLDWIAPPHAVRSAGTSGETCPFARPSQRPRATAAEKPSRRTERYVHDLLAYLGGLCRPSFVPLCQNLACGSHSRARRRRGRAMRSIVVPAPTPTVLPPWRSRSSPAASPRAIQGRLWCPASAPRSRPFQQAADSHHSLVHQCLREPARLAGRAAFDPDRRPTPVACPERRAVQPSASASNFFLKSAPMPTPELIPRQGRSCFAEAPRNQRNPDWFDRCFELVVGLARRPPPRPKGPSEAPGGTIHLPRSSLFDLSCPRSEIAEGTVSSFRLTR